ncbi:MAG: HAMP domain-containing sensor histidine kinase [Ilumatobacter fluminis]|uniref:sensor histidine kinase n=1 Tax=Ilumatobacter fluminis TaxID=467091 RepID=UPI0032EE1302
MSLRWKIALAMAAIAVVSTVAIGAVSYRSTRQQLLSEVDRSLLDVESVFRQGQFGRDPLPERGPLSGLDARIVDSSGSVLESTFPVDFPVDAAAAATLGRRAATTIDTVDTDDGAYRVRTVGFARGAIQFGRSLAETERVLDGLRVRIVLWSLLVGGLAAALGWWISSAATKPLRRLTEAAEQVEATGRLDVEVGPDDRTDEAGRLTAAFRGMLAALARSKDEQRRLVQDAGHELRTPLTSLRTNLDVLDRYPDLSDDDRREIVRDLRAEVDELTDLVDEVVTVATGESSDEPAVELRLDELVADVAERYGRRTGRTIELSSRPTTVTAQRSAVQRAVSCLLDNATKFDPSDEAISVTVAEATVTVADRGPGIDSSDLPYVFERFYRADVDRTRPGSGLGLSIVDAVARRHGGRAFADQRVGGGAEVGFRLGPWPPPQTADSHPPLTSV